MTVNKNNKITAYYRANGRIVTQQQYNVSQGNNNRYQNRPDGRQLYYAYDGLGSVAALSNHQGKLKTRYQYDAFGEVLAGDLSDNPYAFTGQRLDPESNLYHFHFRKYDAGVGVWTTTDPIGVNGGINLYKYVENNPVNQKDLLGLKVTNNSSSPVYVKPETTSESTKVEPNGGVYDDAIDGICAEGEKGKWEVTKTFGPFGRGDITVDDGGVDLYGPDFLNEMGPGGKKDEEFLEERHKDTPPDYGWDNLFESCSGLNEANESTSTPDEPTGEVVL
ncbi:RHS repeat-associated core domain-containing protein [Desulfopila sp. IMCC35008]|uniref:RHS repeat-associated core domain-containing protein n=1 Tax=Desulfopila sp. IMCC35008 TaxID=2653858 RepID=UPI0027155FE7|nr:RHS repeat-associated core domain-containing protein [Desulfopila sp. IMCC35008]